MNAEDSCTGPVVFFRIETTKGFIAMTKMFTRIGVTRFCPPKEAAPWCEANLSRPWKGGRVSIELNGSCAKSL